MKYSRNFQQIIRAVVTEIVNARAENRRELTLTPNICVAHWLRRYGYRVVFDPIAAIHNPQPMKVKW